MTCGQFRFQPELKPTSREHQPIVLALISSSARDSLGISVDPFKRSPGPFWASGWIGKSTLQAQLTTTQPAQGSQLDSKGGVWPRSCHPLPAKRPLVTQNLKLVLNRGEKSLSGMRSLAQLCFVQTQSMSISVFWVFEAAADLWQGWMDWCWPKLKRRVFHTFSAGRWKTEHHLIGSRMRRGCEQGNKRGLRFTKNQLTKVWTCTNEDMGLE